jgi:hypothetical protein
MLAPTGSLGAPRPHAAASSGLPLYQFAQTGSGPLPWNATALTSVLNHTMLVGGPHSTQNATEGVIAYRTAGGHVDLYVQPATGAAQWSDLSSLVATPAPGADPVPVLDPVGRVDVLYVDTTGHLILLAPNDPVSALFVHLHPGVAYRSEVVVDLSDDSGVDFSIGLPSIATAQSTALVAARTATSGVEALTLVWDAQSAVPHLASAANVTTAASLTTSISDPVALDAAPATLAMVTPAGDFTVLSATGATGAWVATDVTASTQTAKVAGALSATQSSDTLYAAALAASGSVLLYSTSLAGLVVGGPAPSWAVTNVSAKTTGEPPLSGQLFLSATPAGITVAGPAANWGDLFALRAPALAGPWSATDVSVTAGSGARTVGTTVAGFLTPSGLNLFAAGVASTPPQGVGVYAIPYAKWAKAITDGWPIISETGALGTQSSPWVGFTSAKSVATSPDFLMGQTIYNSHQRVTWLSFWTVSGPLAGETRAPTTYYNHGFAAGAWVATQIDQYRGLGVGLKPDWVIFDPEGYPDNHSALDAPGGSSAATIAKYATYWSAMMGGWAAGLASVDPSLNAGVYASQSEYRNYQLSSAPLPVFIALAFGGGGPIPVPGASGSNVRGFIAFSAQCTPTSTLQNEEQTLLNPPWAGQFNTLQFNSGVYCPPAPTS